MFGMCYRRILQYIQVVCFIENPVHPANPVNLGQKKDSVLKRNPNRKL